MPKEFGLIKGLQKKRGKPSQEQFGSKVISAMGRKPKKKDKKNKRQKAMGYK